MFNPAQLSPNPGGRRGLPATELQIILERCGPPRGRVSESSRGASFSERSSALEEGEVRGMRQAAQPGVL